MADVELVIKIPDNYDLSKIQNGSIASKIILNAVANGAVLPKGHGRLIDADILRSMYSINRANFNTVVGIQKWIDDAPTIIEGSEEREIIKYKDGKITNEYSKAVLETMLIIMKNILSETEKDAIDNAIKNIISMEKLNNYINNENNIDIEEYI